MLQEVVANAIPAENANMDFFIGSRMHATIGAVSSGVSTIPISYSRKFEGLFETLGYNVSVDGRKLNTDEAVNKIKSYLKDEQLLKTSIKMAQIEIMKCKQSILEAFRNVLSA